MTDQITVPKQTWDAMREALNKLLKRDQRNTCQHEETHRGGVIWEICEGCGMKWADDRGGKPKWRNPPEWDAAELALTAANAVIHPQATEPAGWKLVPIRPTVEMLDAADASDREYSLRAFGAGVHMCQSGEDHWAAMLAAAPEAKQ